ncbi:DUF3325 domain-containing protein [Marivibrio halodurans]|uniref:DUF3325 domain-containing protein n=1 Tax=Marivibrio halodurans TaxID=2039722 RepID=A0A8J7SKB8_9PROT|nr:DUF3325 domain-containing protein [Marivibrio halodurans]MBP5858368.1 DUF3325 domain-containing protein [Marivibrio halodurans]
MIALALAVSYIGMLVLCLAMDRHGRDVLGRVPGRGGRLAARLLGSALLAGALVLCFDRWGHAIGTTAWLGLVTVAGLVLILLLPFSVRAAGTGARMACLLAPLPVGAMAMGVFAG